MSKGWCYYDAVSEVTGSPFLSWGLELSPLRDDTGLLRLLARASLASVWCGNSNGRRSVITVPYQSQPQSLSRTKTPESEHCSECECKQRTVSELVKGMIQVTGKEELHTSYPSPLFKLSPIPIPSSLIHQKPTPLPDIVDILQQQWYLPPNRGDIKSHVYRPSAQINSQRI